MKREVELIECLSVPLCWGVVLAALWMTLAVSLGLADLTPPRYHGLTLVTRATEV